MSNENNSPSGGPGDFMRQWFEMATKAAESCQQWSLNQVSAETMHQARANAMKMWSDYWEQCLRSAPFLGAEKQCMSGGLEYRKQMHEFLGQLNHEMQLATTQDIDQLMRTLRRMSEDQKEQLDDISAHLEDLAEQVEAVAERLDVLEGESSPPAEDTNSNGANSSGAKPGSRARRRRVRRRRSTE
jgi:hypothetical protein